MLFSQWQSLPWFVDTTETAVRKRTRGRRTILSQLNTFESFGGEVLKEFLARRILPNRTARQVDKVVEVKKDTQLGGIARSVDEIMRTLQNSSQAIWDGLTPRSASIFRQALTIMGGPQR
jgi:hypothetical protein